MTHDAESLFVHCIIQSNITFHYCYKGDTSFSTLVQQSHKSLVKYHSQGGRHLYNPDEMEKFCESAARGLFDDIFTAIYNDDKQAPQTRRDIYHQTYGIAMGTPFAVTAANAFMYYHERDIIELYAQHLTLYKGFIDDIFVIWDGTREILLDFFSAMNAKDERIKLTYEISDSKIPFLNLLLFKDSASHTLQYSTFQKPLNKYLYIPFESFHPTSNKKAFIKGELMRYARNSSSFSSFTETRLLFWKRLRLRSYPAKFSLPIFREISYSNRCK